MQDGVIHSADHPGDMFSYLIDVGPKDQLLVLSYDGDRPYRKGKGWNTKRVEDLPGVATTRTTGFFSTCPGVSVIFNKVDSQTSIPN